MNDPDKPVAPLDYRKPDDDRQERIERSRQRTDDVVSLLASPWTPAIIVGCCAALALTARRGRDWGCVMVPVVLLCGAWYVAARIARESELATEAGEGLQAPRAILGVAAMAWWTYLYCVPVHGYLFELWWTFGLFSGAIPEREVTLVVIGLLLVASFGLLDGWQWMRWARLRWQGRRAPHRGTPDAGQRVGGRDV
jgi:hypothetical protein